MKALNVYIKETLDEDNLMWKIEMWFKKKPSEYKSFTDLVNKCKESGVTEEILQEWLDKSKLKLKQFIDFLDDDIYKDDSVTKDYLYLFKKTIENILADKSFEM